MTAEETTYILESEEEISRLSNQHDVIKDALGGQLVLAPLDLSNQPLRILDSATADGTWIRDLAQQYPSIPHEFIGTDIDASNWPKASPSNQSYQNQDMTKPWPAEWKGSFDFVHQRLALAAGGPMQEQIVANLVDLVKPGGYIQLTEAINTPHPSHGPSFQNFITLIEAAYTALDGSLSLAEDIPRWLENVGLADIASRDIDLKLGASNPDPRLARQGAYSTTVAAKGLAQFALSFPAGEVQLSKEQIESHPEELRKELSEKGAVYPLRVVWGRKPL